MSLDYFGGDSCRSDVFSDRVRVLSIGRNPIQVLLIRSDPVRVLSIRSDPGFVNAPRQATCSGSNVVMARCWKPLSGAKISRSSSGVDMSTPWECHVIRHAKKEICNNSARKSDFEFVFSAKDSLNHIVYDLKISQF